MPSMINNIFPNNAAVSCFYGAVNRTPEANRNIKSVFGAEPLDDFNEKPGQIRHNEIFPPSSAAVFCSLDRAVCCH